MSKWLCNLACDRGCVEKNIPRRLHARGRPVCPEFKRWEKAYRRHPLANLATEDVTAIISFEDRKNSVNRSGYSRPSDVLILHDSGERLRRHAVLEFEISSRKFEWDGQNPGTYEFRIVHDPKDCNYAHCNMQVFKDGKRVPNFSRPQGIKLKIREHLGEMLRVALPSEFGGKKPPIKECSKESVAAIIEKNEKAHLRKSGRLCSRLLKELLLRVSRRYPNSGTNVDSH